MMEGAKIDILDTVVDKSVKHLNVVKGPNFIGDDFEGFSDWMGVEYKASQHITNSLENDYFLRGIDYDGDLYIVRVINDLGDVPHNNHPVKGIDWKAGNNVL